MNSEQSAGIPPTNDAISDELDSLLRGEISAVETFAQALEKLSGERDIVAKLETCRASHQARVVRLGRAVRERGGKPSTASGIWGTFAKLYEGGAAAMGTSSAIAALEEGEDHGLKVYRDSLNVLDLGGRALVIDELLPQQSETHDVMRRLKHQKRS